MDVVHVRPELVVEIAFDGVQPSPRYPGGVALRFARVLRYRADKTADEADTIETVRASTPALGRITPGATSAQPLDALGQHLDTVRGRCDPAGWARRGSEHRDHR